jgi:transposase
MKSEKPNFDKISSFILKIKDPIIREVFVYSLNKFFENSNPTFEKFFIKKVKSEKF